MMRSASRLAILLMSIAMVGHLEAADSIMSLDRSYTGVFFTDARHGYVYGDAIIATDDGGRSWRLVRDHTSPLSLSFVDGRTFWMLEGSGELFRFVAGGRDFAVSRPHLPGEREEDAPERVSTFALGAKLGWVACGARLLATTDGGNTWEARLLPPGWKDLRAVWMVDEQHGLGAFSDGAVMGRTSDGGATWSRSASDRQIASLSCTRRGFCAWLAGPHGPLYVSTDLGGSWRDTAMPVELPDRDKILAIHAVRPGLVIAAGTALGFSYLEEVKPFIGRGVQIPAFPPPKALLLVWDGTRWTRFTHAEPRQLQAVQFVDGSNGWLVGDEDLVFETNDGGATLERIPDYFSRIAASLPPSR